MPLYIALSLESPLYFFPFSVFLKVKWLKKKQKIHVPAAPCNSNKIFVPQDVDRDGNVGMELDRFICRLIIISKA